VREPLVTVVVTTRDRPASLGAAVSSALSQTVGDVEVVVVDDGSREPVALGTSGPRLRLARNERPVGLSAARNAGLELARGRWITFLDDDDALLPRMVERSLEAAAASSLSPPVGVLSGVRVVDESGAVLEEFGAVPIPRCSGDILERLHAVRYKNGLFVPVDALRAVGGWDPAIRAWEHDDLLLRLNRRCSIEAVPDAMYLLTDHAGARLTRDFLTCAVGIRTTLRKHRSIFWSDRRAHARYLAEMSKDFLKAGVWLPALGAATRSLVRDPARPHAARQWVGALVGPRAKSWYLTQRGVMAAQAVETRRDGALP
jgi:glycosyltransferase involved in cell wall biosynthesis